MCFLQWSFRMLSLQRCFHKKSLKLTAAVESVQKQNDFFLTKKKSSANLIRTKLWEIDIIYMIYLFI